MSAEERIVQIIPAAPGYYARYEDAPQDTYSPIACWALLEDAEGDQRVVGVDIVGDGDSWSPVLMAGNLKEYVYSHKTLDIDGKPIT